jgi:hypothetical protein
MEWANKLHKGFRVVSYRRSEIGHIYMMRMYYGVADLRWGTLLGSYLDLYLRVMGKIRPIPSRSEISRLVSSTQKTAITTAN